MVSWSHGVNLVDEASKLVWKHKKLMLYELLELLTPLVIAVYYVLSMGLSLGLREAAQLITEKDATLVIPNTCNAIVVYALIVYAAVRIHNPQRYVSSSRTYKIMNLIAWMVIASIYAILMINFITPSHEEKSIFLPSILNLIVWLPSFFIVPAIVIDGCNIMTAVIRSVRTLLKTFAALISGYAFLRVITTVVTLMSFIPMILVIGFENLNTMSVSFAEQLTNWHGVSSLVIVASLAFAVLINLAYTVISQIFCTMLYLAIYPSQNTQA